MSRSFRVLRLLVVCSRYDTLLDALWQILPNTITHTAKLGTQVQDTKSLGHPMVLGRKTSQKPAKLCTTARIDPCRFVRFETRSSGAGALPIDGGSRVELGKRNWVLCWQYSEHASVVFCCTKSTMCCSAMTPARARILHAFCHAHCGATCCFIGTDSAETQALL